MLKRARLLLLATAFMTLGTRAEANHPEKPLQEFISGNELYQQQKFAESLAHYDKALLSGWESPGLFFKQERFIEALVAYERACRLDPRDPDIAYNTRLVQTRLADHRAAPTSNPWQLLLETVSGRFTEDELTWFALIGTLGMLYLFIFARMSRDLKKFVPVAWIVFICVICVSYATLYAKIKLSGHEAIVVRATPARFEPFEKATTHFELLAGLKVVVIDRQNGWIKIQRPDQKTGWIPQEYLTIV
jgi:tetratricopeptide (TPR) repeat protein